MHTHFDPNGTADKPFILPQKDPDFYKTFLRSYNIPELVTSDIKLNPRNLSEVAESQPVNALFDTIK